MWRLIAAVAVGAICAWSAHAQEQIIGKALDLIFPIETLVFKVENLGGKAESLAGQVLELQVKETATETRIELPADILFDFDKADIRPNAAAALNQAADVIRKGAKGIIRIEGYTDSKGKPDYNKKLSERRSAAVKNWLVDREGLVVMKFAVQGFGAVKPVAPNVKPDGSDDPDGRQRNRRVEIVFGRK